MEISIGMKKRVSLLVTEDKTAKAVKSGSLPVLATPVMLALMEEAASEMVDDCVDPELTSVGAMISAEHKAPTPVGMEVTAEAEVTAIDGRKIIFALRAFDEAGEIGSGEHERFIVPREKFTAKAQSRTLDRTRHAL